MECHFTTRACLNNKIKDVCEDLEPTLKKVVNMPACQPMNDTEQVIFGYKNKLKRFLSFRTRCDLVVCDSLSITFLSVDGLARRTIARTSSPCLQLPRSYQLFPELCKELLSILALSSWEIDIV